VLVFFHYFPFRIYFNLIKMFAVPFFSARIKMPFFSI